MTRSVSPAPHSLVENGRFCLGTYNSPFRKVNPLDAKLGSPFSVPRFVKNLRLKEWQHFALANQDFYLSLALFNAKVLGLAQICLYSRKTGSVHFHERMALPHNFQVPMELWQAKASFNKANCRLEITNALEQGFHRIEFSVATKGLAELRGEFVCEHDLQKSQPIVVALPLGRRRAMYSHKNICHLEGELFVDGERHAFLRQESYGLADIHKGFYPFVMKWHWATGGGFNEKKQLVGFNLTDNQVADQESYNENCIWVDGTLHPLPPVSFRFDRSDLYRPWTVMDKHGLVQMTFVPEKIRTVDLNALLVKNRYRGPFGVFNGTLRTAGGEQHKIVDYYGMCEDFYLRI